MIQKPAVGPIASPVSGIVQIAYHVPDIDAAARDFSARFGWGPFFILRHIPLASCTYRGAPGAFDHSSAYGQAGPVMVELVQQHNDGPSAVRDMYGPAEFGLHHMASFTDNLQDSLDRYAAAGFPTAMRALSKAGVEFAFVDLRATHGHMLELYEPSRPLAGFYKMVREAAENWDGSDPVRDL